MVRKGNAEPKIKDFSLQTFYKNDTTQALLQEDKYQLYLFLRNDYNQGNWPVVLQTILQSATEKNIQGFLVTSIPTETLYSPESPAVFNLLLPLRCDPVVIKTATRANPTLVLMKKGTILRKWSYADLDKALPVVLTLEANAAPAIQAPAPDPLSVPPAAETKP